ncbi:MAG: asparagine--tRNA ligase [Bacteroidetes bacterium]|nr:asparagine--tRNA ligase [Bacteroidota bacterium]
MAVETRIEQLKDFEGREVVLKGWLAHKRSSKRVQFLIVRDGSGFCQCVVHEPEVDPELWAQAERVTQESALWVRGLVRRDERQIGGYELGVRELRILHLAEGYPITPKPHGVDFLLDRRHLWLRSRRQWAIMRIRHQVTSSIHAFFEEQGFLKLDAPIFTGNAVEGTTTLFETDFFGQPAYLSQSGQLYAEAMAMAFGRVYTFGPTFRAEKSKTRRHLAEFWMVEPEMAFFDLDMAMDLAEALVERIVQDVLRNRRFELSLLGRNPEVLERVRRPFPRITYTEAVELLRSPETQRLLEADQEALLSERAALEAEAETLRAEQEGSAPLRRGESEHRLAEIAHRLSEIEEELKNIPLWRESARNFRWGEDFGGSDETLLSRHFDRPVLVHRYPAAVKAFYMKRDPEDKRLALGMDMLAPEGYGEIIGGGQREDVLDHLIERIREHRLPLEAYAWYLDLRRYGSVPHAGFGLGLERTLAWICGLRHVRETIPFPRMMGRLFP